MRRRAKGRNPRQTSTSLHQGHAEAPIQGWLQQALKHHQAGDLAAAESWYRRILRHHPTHVDSLYLIGTLCSQRGQHSAATQYLQQAVALYPNHAAAHNNLGLALRELGQPQAAVASLECALALNPNHAETHYNLGNAQRDQGQTEAAAACYARAVALKPDYPKAHNSLGVILHEQYRLEEAASSIAQALALDPNSAAAHYNLGNVRRDQGHIEAAITCFEQALTLNPNFIEARLNLSSVRRDQGEIAVALAIVEQVLSIVPDHAEAHYHRALLWLMQGNMAQGWPAYEWRWHTKEQSPRPWLQPQWDGTPLAGRTILVHAEQGVGDEILFASCLPDLIPQTGHCVIECDPRLVALFARSFPTATVHGGRPSDDLTWLARVPPIDVQMPMGSLARYLRPTLAHFPARVGYLVPDIALRSQWRQRLHALGPGLKVGIAWRSRAVRSQLAYYTRLDDWGPIFSIPGIHFINLQYDDCGAELAAARKRWGIAVQGWKDLDLHDDFDGVAALITAMDLVIAPEATVAALAGSLGVPVWQLSIYGGSWPMLGTDQHPWFPSMRVFRQIERGNWSSTLTQVAAALKQLSQEPRPAENVQAQPPIDMPQGNAASPSTGIDSQPEDVPSWLEEARAHHQAGRLDRAEPLYHRIVKAQPRHVDALYLLGSLQYQRANHDAAVNFLQQALAIDPTHVQAHFNLGVTWQAQGKLEAAAASYEHAIAWQPDYAEAHNNLGVVRKRQQHLDAAIAHFERAAQLSPGHAEAHNNLGVAYRDKGHTEAATASFERALALNPHYAEVHFNLGGTLQNSGHYEAAIASYENALERMPNHAEAHINLGVVRREVGDFDAAAAHFEHVLAQHPDYADAHYNRSLLWLSQGLLEAGWHEYEWRLCTGREPQRSFPQPLWDGSSLAGRTILVHAEQGVGDELMFATCFPDLVVQAGHCIFECDPRLVSIFARAFPSATVYGRYQWDDRTIIQHVPPIDVQIAAGSLPRYTRPTCAHFPTRGDYLRPDPQRLARWSQRLRALGPGLKVGIAWRSRASRRHHPCYTSLDQWESILRVPGVHFVNLQYDQAEAERLRAEQQWGIPMHAWDDLDLFNDFEAVAALIAALDLVLVPEMTVATLAGSLGQQVWRLTGFAGSWDFLGTPGQPWFPSVRMFCQPQPGDWASVIHQIAETLQHWIHTGR